MSSTVGNNGNNNPLRVCVVGAGVSGLPSVRWCLAEGFDVLCYEATDDLGGLWNYRPHMPEGHATVMKSTIINTSKEMMTYSDFVPSADYCNFMHNTKVLEWLRQYAEEHKLLQYVKFAHKVTKVTPAADYEETGCWSVETDAGGEQRFDAVLVCNGHHATMHWPHFDGLDKFKGIKMHSQSYREPSAFVDKRALVVGIGNSAMDICVELARVCKEVHLSTRRGAWVWARVGPNGQPYDTVLLTRANHHKLAQLPSHMLNLYMENMVNRKFDHEAYGIKPKHRFFSQHPTINDALPNCLLSGQIVLKGDVSHFTETGVVFDDGAERDIDLVVLCTGYEVGYPFLEPPSVVPVDGNKVDLYKWVFPPHLRHNSLAVIGNIQPYGSISPISEMQARLACRVLAGAVRLPDEAAMRADIGDKRRAMDKRYVRSLRHTVQVDYVEYMDELAGMIGCRPDMWHYATSDPLFWCRLMFGPNVPYVYRLNGPHPWHGARAAIEGAQGRIDQPMRNRDTGVPPESKPLQLSAFAAVLLVLLAAAYYGLGAVSANEHPVVFAAGVLGLVAAATGYAMVLDVAFDLATCLA